MTIDKPQTKPLEKTQRFWILGAGRFGQLAVQRILRRYPLALITLVDRTLPDVLPETVVGVKDDTIDWLVEHFRDPGDVDWILPAVPVHVAAAWIRKCLQEEFSICPVPVADAWSKQMPNPLRGETGQLYVSHADFICPDNCPEPAAICTHTGRARPEDLFRLLARRTNGALLPIVVRSHQLLPGVGGLLPRDLMAAKQMVRKHRKHDLMVATACRCHGVVDILHLEVKAGH